MVSAVGSSNIDVNSIVSQLMTVENKSLDKYDSKISDIQTKLSAYGMVMNSLSVFQANLQPLTNLSKDKTSTDNDNASVSLTPGAGVQTAYGTYNFAVSQLAQSQSLTLQNIASKDAVIGTGTLTFSFGEYNSGSNTFTANTTKSDKSITIDSSNNTLSGIKDAINKAGMGVTANIINTGNGYTLAISSESGAKNSLKISVNDADGTNANAAGLSQLSFDPTGIKQLTQVQEAKSALATLDGVSLQSNTNAFTGIDGVTVNANKVGNSVIKIEKDNSGVTSAVTNFVKSFNDLNSTIKRLSSYDSAAKKGGVLTGDSTVRELQNKLRQSIFSEVGDVGTGQTLSSLGISFQKDGTLSLDSSKLSTALQNDSGKVMRMLSKSGEIVDRDILVTGVTDKTKPGSYGLTISQLATQGALTAGNAVANFTIDSSNNSVGLEVNGVQNYLTLDSGTYTKDTLVSQLQAKLSVFNTKLNVSMDASNKLSITTQNFGSDQSIKLLTANGNNNLFGTPTETAGTDVKGSVGNVSITGAGQVLTGKTATDIDGLSLTVMGGSTGDRGTVYISKGMYGLFNDLSQSLQKDTLASKKDSLSNQMTSLNKQRESQVKRLASVEQRYRAQFTALDTMLSGLNQTSSYLTTQLAKLG